MIEVEQVVTHPEHPNQKYEVIRTIPNTDFKGDEQVWAVLRNLRTGKVSSHNIKQLEHSDERKRSTKAGPIKKAKAR